MRNISLFMLIPFFTTFSVGAIEARANQNQDGGLCTTAAIEYVLDFANAHLGGHCRIASEYLGNDVYDVYLGNDVYRVQTACPGIHTFDATIHVAQDRCMLSVVKAVSPTQ